MQEKAVQGSLYLLYYCTTSLLWDKLTIMCSLSKPIYRISGSIHMLS